MKITKEIRDALDKDAEAFREGRMYFKTHMEEPYKYGTPARSEIIENGIIPKWALDFMESHKKRPGDKTSSYGRDY